MAAPDGSRNASWIFARISLALLACFAVATLVVTLFSIEFPHALDGTPKIEPGSAPNYVRNLLELLSFFSNVALVVTALGAILFAKRQLDSAQQQNAISLRSNQAGVYSALYDMVMGSEVQAGLGVRGEIFALYRAATPAMSLGDFAIATMATWRRTDIAKFTTATNLLSFLEHIGLLVRREYLAMDDVYYLLEGPLKDAAATFGPYLEKLRLASDDQRMCEHAIWLLNEIQDYVPEHELRPARRKAAAP